MRDESRRWWARSSVHKVLHSDDRGDMSVSFWGVFSHLIPHPPRIPFSVIRSRFRTDVSGLGMKSLATGGFPWSAPPTANPPMRFYDATRLDKDRQEEGQEPL